jgi:predicted metal-dependent hydrolase
MRTSVHHEPGMPPITIIRRKRQRTMRIRVKSDQIIVSGPGSVSEKQLIDFVREKSGWIHKSSLKGKERGERLELMKKQYKGTLLLRGDRKPVTAFPVSGLRKPRLIEYDHAVVYQFCPFSDRISGIRDEDNEPAPDPDEIRTFYLQTAKQELTPRYMQWSDRLPVQPGRLIIRNQKTKWGSCSRRKTISLNWRLVKCPPSIMDYIIIHELCHLRHFNHSKAFWDTVAHYYPDVRQARRWIRKHTDEIFSDF